MVQIRHATAEDYEDIADLLNVCFDDELTPWKLEKYTGGRIADLATQHHLFVMTKADALMGFEIGRASCRERVCMLV